MHEIVIQNIIRKEVKNEETFFPNCNRCAGSIYISIPDILSRTDRKTGGLSRRIPPVATYQIDGNRERPSSLRFFWRHSPYLCKQKALDALKKEKSFPDGAVLIFDLLEAKSEDNAIIEGPHKVVGVMQKDSKKFKDTGGWGFEGFKGDTKERVVTDPKSACFNCHEPQRQKDYVFSSYRK
jgi:hypothetical protein